MSDDVEAPDAPDVEPADATDGRRRPWSAERRAQHAAAQKARREREKGGGTPEPADRPRRRSVAQKPGSTARQKPLRPRLQQAYETLGTVVGIISVPDGQAILAHSEACADAVAEWAEQDPRVRAALERLLTGSALGKVVVAHLPIALAVAVNHNLVPASGLAALFGPPVDTAAEQQAAFDAHVATANGQQ